MSAWTRRVQVARRFQRFVRLDSDLFDPAQLDGFVGSRTFSSVVETMARHAAAGQCAFTWTGPYGVGKSSLAVALRALLSSDARVQARAEAIFGARTARVVRQTFPPRAKGWYCLPVVGRRDRPAQVVGQAIADAQLIRTPLPAAWSDEAVLGALHRIAGRLKKTRGGLIVFLDEMGKFLEGATDEGGDIYFFQQLAEMASRSGNRLLVIGILHQAFEEYAHRFARRMRDEWAKIQGRFVDIALHVGAEEQLELISYAIRTDERPVEATRLGAKAAALLPRQLPVAALAGCWPLNPIAACLLGPISRRRFGQNQRSVFGFLNSAEPCGFQDFLQNASAETLYGPERLWDYLRINLEPSIMASPDSHRWTMAVDALERCLAVFGDGLHGQILKVIALVGLFRERSGLVAGLDLFEVALPRQDRGTLAATLDELEGRSLILHRKFSGEYSIFEGSDFDIEKATQSFYAPEEEEDFAWLAEAAALQPIVAKRHYHATGALRWCNTALAPMKAVASFAHAQEACGTFLLALPGSAGAGAEEAAACRSALPQNVVLGVSERSAWNVVTLARELKALEQVRDKSPELQGDRIARTEVATRMAELAEQLHRELDAAWASARWHGVHAESRTLNWAQRNSLASELADSRYPRAPRIHNELLNRSYPSSNAVAARNALLRRMIAGGGGGGGARLGIEGHPPEGGLFDSILAAAGLYRRTGDTWHFAAPDGGARDPCRLGPIWQAARALLEDNSQRAVPLTEIYAIWKSPPFGIKEGLLPLLAVTFLLTEAARIALYRMEIFQPALSELDAELLSKNPADIRIRWVNLSDEAQRFLMALSAFLDEPESRTANDAPAPLEVARKLVATFDQLPDWVGRTRKLSPPAQRIRHILKQARDPNQLLFNDIPHWLGAEQGQAPAFDKALALMRAGLRELQTAYPQALQRLQSVLLTELGLSARAEDAWAELRDRARNIRQLSGDLRLEAFVARIAAWGGTPQEMEALASMAINKPARHWIDADLERAELELAALARRFVYLEAFAHVKGRQDRSQAIALVVGLDSHPVTAEFRVSDREQDAVAALIQSLRSTADAYERHIVLTALAQLAAETIDIKERPDLGAKETQG